MLNIDGFRQIKPKGVTDVCNDKNTSLFVKKQTQQEISVDFLAEILWLLGNGSMSVVQLVEATGKSKAAVYGKLMIQYRKGVVTFVKEDSPDTKRPVKVYSLTGNS